MDLNFSAEEVAFRDEVRAFVATHLPADIRDRVRRGDELGWFEHGSTIIVFAPRGFRLCDGIADGTKIRMGQRLMVLP